MSYFYRRTDIYLYLQQHHFANLADACSAILLLILLGKSNLNLNDILWLNPFFWLPYQRLEMKDFYSTNSFGDYQPPMYVGIFD